MIRERQTLNVLHVIPQLHMGGMERGILDICKESQSQGIRSWVVSEGGPWVAHLQAMGVEHITAPVTERSRVSENLKILSDLVSNHENVVVHARSRLSRQIIAQLFSRLESPNRPTVVYSVHSYSDCEDPPEVFEPARIIIAVSNDLAQKMLLADPSLKDRLEVVPNGVDLGYFSPNAKADPSWLSGFYQQYPNLRDKYVVSLIARLSQWKGPDRFLNIMAGIAREHPQVHGLIIGTTPQIQHRNLARKLGWTTAWKRIQNVTIAAAEVDVRNIYAISSLVLSLSNDPPETYGRTLMESLACGVPVIGYNHGGAGEFAFKLFPQGGVAPLDDAAIQQKIIEFMDTAPNTPAIPSSLSSESCARNTIDIYRRLSNGSVS